MVNFVLYFKGPLFQNQPHGRQSVAFYVFLVQRLCCHDLPVSDLVNVFEVWCYLCKLNLEHFQGSVHSGWEECCVGVLPLPLGYSPHCRWLLFTDISPLEGRSVCLHIKYWSRLIFIPVLLKRSIEVLKCLLSSTGGLTPP